MTKHLKGLACTFLAALLCASLCPAALAASAYDRPNQKLAALTFDDGPGAYSDSILDTLKSHNAKATFFMNGYKVYRYAEQVQRMVSEGHQIGNHTYNHPYLAKLTDGKIWQEVNATAEALTDITGVAGTGNTGFYLRPPYGSFNARVAAASGVPVIWCTVDSGDWKYKDSNRLVSYTSSVLEDGDIVVMHETHATTAQGLGRLLDRLQEQGFELVTLEDLFWRRGITPEPGQIYYSAKDTGVNRCPKKLWFDENQLETHWAYSDIAAVQELGLMIGNDYGEFLPNFTMTRGMFITTLGRLSGVTPEVTSSTGFLDVPEEHYAAPYVLWARETGIMIGTSDDHFNPDGDITRQEMATVLARYTQHRGVAAEEVGDLSGYSDQASIADWAREGVAFCTALGLLQGSNDQFRPLDLSTRAMGAAVLARLSRVEFPDQAKETQVEETPDQADASQAQENPSQTADDQENSAPDQTEVTEADPSQNSDSPQVETEETAQAESDATA